ncbi:hypothetical protein M9434_004625 [Picochlorum sp. BPE23]|nr:hypothetical protein M9434_000606 [Picochlorum sp. BPE23]KAI8107685.1 hypothetical protein M9435_002713 [Picochlorum sp. BPE23]KAI8111052.1 hypothetical protein M9434_004625 [Picochlorum sp. BPE23]
MSSFVEKLRRMSTGNKTDDSQAASPRNNVWSSTFDPGRNANMKKMGSSYYDKPAAGDSATVWDQHLEAQKQAAPQSPTSANNQVGQKTIDKEDLQKMMNPSNVEAAMQKVDPSGTGKIDFDQFMSQLRSVQN